MPLRVKLDTRLLNQLRRVEEPVLAALEPVVFAQAASIINASVPLAPVGNVDPEGKKLRDSEFIDGPVRNSRALSVSATSGYEHPHAGAIHEGFHWGKRTMSPPNFLRTPARAARSAFTRKVRDSIKSTLGALFPSR